MMSWASYFVRFGSALFVLPLVIKLFTDVEQSFWFFINTIIAFAMLADSGFGPTLIRAVSYFMAGADYLPRNKKEYDAYENVDKGKPNLDKLANLLTTANRIYIFLGFFAMLLIGTGGIAAVWNIMELSNHQTDLWIAFFLVIPYVFFMVMSVKWVSFMRGLGYVADAARFGAFQGMIRILIFVILLLFKLGPAYLIGFMVLESLIRFFYFKWFVQRWIRKEGVVIKKRNYFDREVFRSIWSATWRTGLLSVGAYGIQSGTSILAAQISDAAMMASFLFTMRIFTFIINLARAPFYTNVPKIYQLAAQKDMAKLRKRSAEYMFLGFAVMIAASLVIIFFGNASIEMLNLGDRRFVALPIFIIIVLTEMLDLHASFHATVYTSTNHVPFVLPATISGALILLVGFQVLPVYGLMGIVASKFIIQWFVNNWYAPYLSLRLMKWPFVKYLLQFPTYGFKYIFGIAKSVIPGSR